MKGTVIKSTGSWYLVRDESGKLYKSRLRGKIKLQGLKLSNPVAVGDVVEFAGVLHGEGAAQVHQIDRLLEFLVLGAEK